MTPFLLILILVVAVTLFIVRVELMEHTRELSRTGHSAWRAWHLSAIEPLITAVITIFSIFFVTARQAEGWWPDVLIAPLSVMLYFALRMLLIGRTYQRGRLVFSILLAQIGLLVATFFVGATAGFVCVGVAIALRIIWGLYQARVTPNFDEFTRWGEREGINIFSDEEDAVLALAAGLDEPNLVGITPHDPTPVEIELETQDTQSKTIKRLKFEESDDRHLI